MEEIKKAKFVEPTPIQVQSILYGITINWTHYYIEIYLMFTVNDYVLVYDLAARPLQLYLHLLFKL